jgi:endonuclease III
VYKKKKAAWIFQRLPAMIRRLKKAARRWRPPVVGEFARSGNVPYKVLIATLLSLRTKDAVTLLASQRLFQRACQPAEMLALSARQIEKLIYPVGFYRTKAKNIRTISRQLIERFHSRVPDCLERLLTLPGVGRKTANLVMILGYGKPGICVDTHVHRICNRCGLVRTETPDETEQVLRRVLPKRYWMAINELLVAFGQNLCVPVSPFCGRCMLAAYCQRCGVVKSR